MKLIICESPGKIKSIKKYAGAGFECIASFGHVIDLPEKSFGVNLKKDFEATFEVKSDKHDVLKNIKTHAKSASVIYLMTDGDREGSGIAANLLKEIQSVAKCHVYRAVTHEITQSGVKKALDTAGEIDQPTVEAYLTRRILDRIVGFRTSFLTKQATGGKSAGRVQSVILRILVDREKEIIAFKPEEYWVLTANFVSPSGEVYVGLLDDSISVPSEIEATKIYEKVMNADPGIVKVADKKMTIVNALAPFTTVSMVSAASTYFGWTASKTMKMAQSLYEAGKCSYHRTDSTFMAAEAVTAVRGFITTKYGASYLPEKPNFYSASKGAQEAHECCRATNILDEPGSASSDEDKLYDMIWRRTVACHMTPGKDEKTKVVTHAAYNFMSNGSRVEFDGFRKAWTFGKHDDKVLPELNVGDKCKIKSLEKEQKWTLPPSRYSDGSLAKKCDAEQIVRPSTVAAYFDLLKDRGYITRKNKSFVATELGMRVVDFLVAANMCFVDIEFTADLEKQLDEIQASSKTKLEVLTAFWTRLKTDIENGKQVKADKEVTTFKCPKCDAFLLLKHSYFGQFFVCQNSKQNEKISTCDYKANVGDHGEPVEKIIVPKEYASFPCNKCGAKMVKRTSKAGNQFFGCEKFFKGCRATASLEGEFKVEKTGYKKFKKWKKKAKKGDSDES